MIEKEMLSKYKNRIIGLRKVIEDLSPEILACRPEIEEAWTIEEHMSHLWSVEVNQFLLVNPAVFAEDSTSELLADFLSWKPGNCRKTGEMLYELRTAVTVILETSRTLPDFCHLKSSLNGLLDLNWNQALSALNSHIDSHESFIRRNLESVSDDSVRSAL